MTALIRSIRAALRAAADPEKAVPMQAYMKTDMPFYGVQKPGREQILKTALREHPLTTRAEHRAAIEALWALPHREEKYLAVRLTHWRDEWITPSLVPLYERMIRTGAWWDFVDDLASRLVGRALQKDRAKLTPRMKKWIDHDDMWLRRSAIICQLRHKDETDEKMLFDFSLRRAHEKEFFIRKGIGWALRQHAYTNPDGVRKLLVKHRDKWSKLTWREAGKHLGL